jgi:hypothetical protein
MILGHAYHPFLVSYQRELDRAEAHPTVRSPRLLRAQPTWGRRCDSRSGFLSFSTTSRFSSLRTYAANFEAATPFSFTGYGAL